LPAEGRALGWLATLLAIEPLEQHENHEVASENANCKEQSWRHTYLARNAATLRTTQSSLEWRSEESPEEIVRKILGGVLTAKMAALRNHHESIRIFEGVSPYDGFEHDLDACLEYHLGRNIDVIRSEG
jgi:ribosomal protein L13